MWPTLRRQIPPVILAWFSVLLARGGLRFPPAVIVALTVICVSVACLPRFRTRSFSGIVLVSTVFLLILAWRTETGVSLLRKSGVGFLMGIAAPVAICAIGAVLLAQALKLPFARPCSAVAVAALMTGVTLGNDVTTPWDDTGIHLIAALTVVFLSELHWRSTIVTYGWAILEPCLIIFLAWAIMYVESSGWQGIGLESVVTVFGLPASGVAALAGLVFMRPMRAATE